MDDMKNRMSHGGDIYRNKAELDFSVNLNVQPIPEIVRDAMGKGLENAGVYPDPEEERLRKALAAADGVEKECVFAGNGASEMILAAVRAIAPRTALLVEPCFSGYRYALNSLCSCQIRSFRLREEQDYDLTEEILEKLTPGTGLLFLTDPWNPTGRNLDPRLLKKILLDAAEKEISVILDQSFYLLSQHGQEPLPVREWLNRFENLVLIRSYTKLFGLPGIRMGYALASPDWIRRIRQQLPEWNLSSVAGSTMEVCARLLRDDLKTVFDWKKAKKEKEVLSEALERLGCRVFRSDTIYLLFRTVPGLWEQLLAQGILIRDCRDLTGLEKGYYRIAVKDHDSNARLVRSMERVLRNCK